jgi:hypothetical protein
MLILQSIQNLNSIKGDSANKGHLPENPVLAFMRANNEFLLKTPSILEDQFKDHET